MLPRSYVNVVQGTGSSNSQSVPHDTGIDKTINHSLQNNESVVDNNSHPLYLHNNDHPGLVLIAKKLIGPENFTPWSRSMQIALNARNKFVIVNGAYEQPDPKSSLYAQWERVNDMIITWILNSVADDISDSLNFVTTAKDVWNELHERFSGVNGHRIYQVLKSIHNSEQGNRSVEVYFHKLKGLWDEYAVLEPSVNCVCGAHKTQTERDQNRKLLQFLMGLHDSNATVRGQILMMSPLPSVSQAYAYVKQDEKARQGFQTLDLAAGVNATFSAPDHANVAAFVKKYNANKGNPSSGSNSSKPVIKCSFCNFTGHTRENCYKLIGYPPNWKKKDKSTSSNTGQDTNSQFRKLPSTANQVTAETLQSQSQVNQMQQQINQLTQMMQMFVGGSDKSMKSPEEHLAGMAISSLNLVHSVGFKNVWLIDSGATDHMCCSLDFLKDVQLLSKPISVVLPDSSHIMVTHAGSLVMNNLCLNNVFLIPDFSYNLISVSKWISDTKGIVNFYTDHCTFVTSDQNEVLATGTMTNGLYCLDLNSSINTSSGNPKFSANSVASKTHSSALWHMRLGHASSPVLHKISSVSPYLCDESNKKCPICPLSKQTKLPFPVSNSRADHIFDLIHVDLWGPYAHETTNGCRFFLTIVDDHSRAVWTYLLPTKQHAIGQLIRFFAYVENQFHTSIKTFRSDHGTEFVNHIFTSFLLDKGVLKQTSCVNTPAQNGRVERKHRQLLSIARSLRFQSGLPIRYWGECILTASYITNRLPSPVIDFKTPYDCLYGVSPDYSVLRVFGCLAYASIHENDKFSSRAIKSVFIGYPLDHKGYKLLNFETKQIFVSRHVVFS